MKTTLNWLKEYCEFDLPAKELAHRLSMSGVLVEEVIETGEDVVLVIEATSNRPDLLGAIGIAREVSALVGAPLRLPPVEFQSSAEPIESAASVEVSAPDLCPRYTARLIRGVRVGPSPEWLRRRLAAIGVRSINNVVDVTNYVLYECGQPLHAFDFARLRGGKIVVRRAREGETLVAIDGTKCRLTPDRLVIADAERPVAVAGVMGGQETEVSESTSDVLLESAEFDRGSVRRTARALLLSSDSSYRFERGVDPVQVEWASRRATRLILETAGGRVCRGVLDIWQWPYRPAQIRLRFDRIGRVLGTAIPPDAAVVALERLGFEVVGRDAAGVAVAVPPFRARDVYREIDLIEEVIRIHGYDRIPERTGMRVVAGRVSKGERVEALVREALVGMGYQEVITSSFCTEAVAALVSPWSDLPAVGLTNTVRRDENRLRVSVLPELLRVKRTNLSHGVPVSPLFEIGCVFLRRPPRESGEPLRDDARPMEKRVLAILDDADIPSLKGALEALFRALRLNERPRFVPLDCAFFEKGRAARILLGETLLGVIGETGEAPAALYDLPRRPCVAEMDLDLLVGAANLERTFSRLPTYPASERDLAVVVDETVTWAEIEDAVRRLDLPNLQEIRFFDIFRGKPVPPGKKSIAFTLAFRAPDRTLTREEVEEARQRCIEALEAMGAHIRR